ncbi:pentapeptide repeat-containing protein [Actinoplanes couchii]|uniref:Pentapeptide repeat protein n=1 Tax=Actinoplanes couchii TaxID=403638 RepID=A0ABQ3X681_9ACTN|nr:pentapeptide repeat-containing protein [Actinoplanes couchii]MDR6325275.1 hypothetical protein [Actinoplanes couchii]GID54021.1 hypothetical protein Aco03nite_024250 [Actinoplanes couchii]
MTELAADCSRCAALCCVAPAFSKSSDFAVDKPAGRACRNLGDDFRCTVHEKLIPLGFPGCVVFVCFGAGQRITRERGGDWRSDRAVAAEMFAALPVVRQLHELMWYLTEALKLDETRRLHPKLRVALAETDALAGTPDPRKLDLDSYRRKVVPLLRRASAAARSGHRGPDHSGAHLIGRRMRGADLRGASFRGALLIGADLRDTDLRRADFTGADMRGTDLRGANLNGVLFLTSSQLRAAVTDPDQP